MLGFMKTAKYHWDHEPTSEGRRHKINQHELEVL